MLTREIMEKRFTCKKVSPVVVSSSLRPGQVHDSYGREIDHLERYALMHGSIPVQTLDGGLSGISEYFLVMKDPSLEEIAKDALYDVQLDGAFSSWPGIYDVKNWWARVAYLFPQFEGIRIAVEREKVVSNIGFNSGPYGPSGVTHEDLQTIRFLPGGRVEEVNEMPPNNAISFDFCGVGDSSACLAESHTYPTGICYAWR